jgi:hypothetical protein
VQRKNNNSKRKISTKLTTTGNITITTKDTENVDNPIGYKSNHNRKCPK